jgi:hypothetical protein
MGGEWAELSEPIRKSFGILYFNAPTQQQGNFSVMN